MAYLAPAGTPVRLRDLAHGLACTGNSAAAESTLTDRLSAIAGTRHAWSLSSGRAAMTLTLTTMRAMCDDISRDEVIIPAYTCYSVPAAIERAGLKIRLCDVDPDTLGIDPESLEHCDLSRALAVVSANLYGLPNDLEAIEAICKRHETLMLDDAAQAIGATFNGRAAGSFGDAGLYSFDKGKIISTIQGGAIIASDGRLASLLAESIGNLPDAGQAHAFVNALQLVAYSMLLRPALYGLVRRMPFTGLGQTRYETRYAITRLSAFQCGVASQLLARVAALNQERRRTARRLSEAISGLPGIAAVRVLPRAEPVFARFPLRVSAAGARDRLLADLERAGIGATASYPLSLADVAQVVARIPSKDRAMPGAREVARSIMTLPTHAYCPPDLGERVRRAIIECLG